MKYIKLFTNNAAYEEYVATKHPTPNVSLAAAENDVHYGPYVHDYANDYLTFVAKADGRFWFSGNSVNYSLDDGETWTTLASYTNTPTVTSGKKIMWKATLTPSTNGIGKFISSAKFDVEGNPMSLLFGDDFKDKTSLEGKNYAFSYLFSGNTNVVSAENMSLPATTLANFCYYGMFQGCTSLTMAPQLLATTLAKGCCLDMFYNCTSLTTAPELLATRLADWCYREMFNGCTSLTTAPQLPATTLAESCYNNMFRYCSGLTTAPSSIGNSSTAMEVSACTNMFQGCTSLTEAPELLATTLKDYCYGNMFNGCTKLNYIKCLATNISASNCTNSWVSNVAAIGTFVKAASMSSWTEGVNGIPSGWSVQDAS